MMPLSGGLSPLGRKVGGAAQFVPTDIAGCKLWLKADAGLFQDSAGSTPATADSDPVGRWSDQSGQGNHATQTTTTKRFTYRVISGVGRLRADGVDDCLLLPVMPNIYSLFIVGQYTGASANGMWIGKFNTIWGFVDDVNAGYVRWNSIGGGMSFARNTNIHVISFVTTGTGAVGDMYLDGALGRTGTVTGSNGTLDGIAFRRTPGDKFLAADYYEILAYDTGLSSTDRQSVEAYLKTRWGTP